MPFGRNKNILAASAVAIVAPNNLNTNVLVSVPVPGGAMGPDGILRITTAWDVASASNKTLAVTFGGFAVLNFVTNNALANIRSQIQVANRGVENLQFTNGPANIASFGLFAGGETTFNLNTAVTQNLEIVAIKTTAAHFLRLDYYLVELIVP